MMASFTSALKNLYKVGIIVRIAMMDRAKKRTFEVSRFVISSHSTPFRRRLSWHRVQEKPTSQVRPRALGKLPDMRFC